MAEPPQVPGVSCAYKGAVLGGAINSHRFKNATERLEKLIETYTKMTGKKERVAR